MTPRSAKNAKIRIGNATYAHQNWEVTPQANVEDSTHSESGGYFIGTPCIVKAEVSIQGEHDAAQNPYDAPVGVQAGAVLANVKLYLNDVTGPFWSFPLLIVESSPNSAPIKSTLKINIKAVGTGTFVYPTGAA